MLHEIEDGPITVVKVINPCFYWVRCSKCVRPVEISAGLKNCKFSTHEELKRGQKVLLDFFDKQLYRGVVQGTVSGQGPFPSSYELYMIDTLTTIEASRDRIFTVDEAVSSPQMNWMNLPTQFHIIGIEGASPVGHIDCEMHLIRGQSSEEFRLNRIQTILKSADWLEFKKKSIAENVVFGKIKLGKDNSRQNLLRILIKEGFANYSLDFMNILKIDGCLEEIQTEINLPKNKMNPRPLVQIDNIREEPFLQMLPLPKHEVSYAVIDELNRDMDRAYAVETILPIIRFETFDQFNERMRTVSKMLADKRASSTEIDHVMEKDVPNVEDESKTSSDNYVNSPCDSICSFELTSNLSDCDAFNSKNKTNVKPNVDYCVQSSHNILEEKSNFVDCDDSSSHMSASLSHEPKSNTDGISVFGAKTFGRGKLIMKREEKFGPSPNEDSDSSKKNVNSTEEDKFEKNVPEINPSYRAPCPADPPSKPICAHHINSTWDPTLNNSSDLKKTIACLENQNVNRNLSPKMVAGRGQMVDLFKRSSPVNEYVNSDSSVISIDEKCCPSRGISRGRLLFKKTPSRCSSVSEFENQKSSQFDDLDESQRGNCDFVKTIGGVINHSKPGLGTVTLSSAESTSSEVSANGYNYKALSSKFVKSFFSGSNDESSKDSKSVASKSCSDKETSKLGEEKQPVETSSIIGSEGTRSIGTNNSLSDLSLMKLSDASKSTAGILFGADEILTERFASLELHEFIYKSVRKYGYLTRPQQFAMPAILKRRNVVLISANKTKKSTACVLPVLNLLLDKDYYSALRKGNGPRCVIVAPSSDRVKKLSLLCFRLSGSSLSIISTHGGGLELERKNELSSGCDVLVTTPRCWLRLLEYPVVTNMSRLCHLILDRFDIISELFPHELQSISNMIKDAMKMRALKNDELKNLSVQTVISAQRWSFPMEKMVTSVLKSPILIFTNYLEASLYAGIKPTVVVLKPDIKMEKLLDILKKNASKKIVVACNSANDVNEIRNMCASASLNTVVAHEQKPKSFLSGVPDLWKSENYPILVCTDPVLPELNVTDAQMLIHFSLPLSKTSFTERFVVFRDAIPDKLLNPQATPPNCSVFIFIDETFDAPFPFIIEFLKRISSKLPRKILNTSKEITRKKELLKTSAPFCENLLQRGDCYKMVKCSDRHVILPDVDKPKRVLNSKGYLKIQISNVCSAVKLAVRILGYSSTLSNFSWTTPKSDFMFMTVKMASYFASRSNRRLHGRPQVGDMIAYQESIDQPFHRARVVKVVDKNDRDEPTVVRLFLVDNGIHVDEAMTHALFELPEEFKSYPDQIVFVYLAKLMPVDLDTSWSFAAKILIEKAIHKQELEDNGEQEIIAKVLFSIGDNFVVDNLLWCKHLTHSVHFVLDLRRLILQSGCGIDCPNYVTNLRKIYEESDFSEGICHQLESSTEEMEHPAQFNRRWDQLRWAHLSREEEFSLVKVSAIESPSLFYVNLIAFHKRLLDLQNELKGKIIASPTYLTCPSVGDVCAIENSKQPGTWNRGMVLQVKDGSAEVFLVDYGNKTWLPYRQLFTIPWNLVIRIPFQAIECQLFAVHSNDESTGWSNLAIDAFQHYTAAAGNIYAKTLDFDLKSHQTGGKRYHVILSNFETDKPILLNKKFVVDLGFGVWELKNGVDEGELLEGVDAFRKLTEVVVKPEGIDEMASESSNSDDDDWDGNASTTSGAPGALEEIQNTNNTTDEVQMNLQWDSVDQDDLKEFVAAMFPQYQQLLGPQNRSKKSIEAIERSISPNSNNCHQEESKGTAIITPRSEHNCVESEYSLGKNELNIFDELPDLVYVDQFKTPTVHWRQDLFTVTIMYMVPGIKHYLIHPYTDCICFNAIVETSKENDEYWSRIPLFGAVTDIVSETLSLTSVRITLTKSVRGYLWPRLTYLKGNNARIKLDPEVGDQFEAEPPSSIVNQLFEKGWKTCVKRGWNVKERQPNSYVENFVPEGYDDDDDLDDSHQYEKLPDALPDELDPFS